MNSLPTVPLESSALATALFAGAFSGFLRSAASFCWASAVAAAVSLASAASLCLVEGPLWRFPRLNSASSFAFLLPILPVQWSFQRLHFHLVVQPFVISLRLRGSHLKRVTKPCRFRFFTNNKKSWRAKKFLNFSKNFHWKCGAAVRVSRTGLLRQAGQDLLLVGSPSLDAHAA